MRQIGRDDRVPVIIKSDFWVGHGKLYMCHWIVLFLFIRPCWHNKVQWCIIFLKDPGVGLESAVQRQDTPYRKELHWNSIKFPLFFWALKHHWFSSSQIWDITSTIKCLPKKTSYFPVSSKNSLKVHWNPIETPLKMNTYANEFDQ